MGCEIERKGRVGVFVCVCVGGWGVGGACSLIQLMQNQCNVRLDRQEHTLHFFLVLDLIYLNLHECVLAVFLKCKLKVRT